MCELCCLVTGPGDPESTGVDPSVTRCPAIPSLKNLRFQDSREAMAPGLQTCIKAVAIPISKSKSQNHRSSLGCETGRMRMRIGYARVSTADQNPDLQEDELQKAGCEKIFRDVASSAVDCRRGLAEAIEYARDGDTPVVWN